MAASSWSTSPLAPVNSITRQRGSFIAAHPPFGYAPFAPVPRATPVHRRTETCLPELSAFFHAPCQRSAPCLQVLLQQAPCQSLFCDQLPRYSTRHCFADRPARP